MSTTETFLGADLLSDAAIARSLALSKSWVRKQRFNRRHGLPHVLDIDPVVIGRATRYASDEFSSWLERQKAGRKAAQGRAGR
jgi:hypothetical protein